jgi:hypothetical protein
MTAALHARLRRRLLGRMGRTLMYARAISWRDAVAAIVRSTIGGTHDESP